MLTTIIGQSCIVTKILITEYWITNFIFYTNRWTSIRPRRVRSMIELCWTRCVATQITILVLSTVFALLCFTRDMHHWLTNCPEYCEKQNVLTRHDRYQVTGQDCLIRSKQVATVCVVCGSVIITQYYQSTVWRYPVTTHTLYSIF